MIKSLLAICAFLMCAATATADPLVALARVDAGTSKIEAQKETLIVSLGLSQPVPYRVVMVADPPRLVIDFHEVAWDGINTETLVQTDKVLSLAAGPVKPGLSRLAAVLHAPYVLELAEIRALETGLSELRITLRKATPEEFATQVVSEATLLGANAPPNPARPTTPLGPLHVMLDPGHGGVDPGAIRGGVDEASLMLIFARELKEQLLRDGFRVSMTRNADVFVSLEGRIALAHAAGADVLLSLHADALSEGQARGATVYTLSDTASDVASALLAERHDRANLLAGVDLTHQDDVVADVLMDLARAETAPRADLLADALVVGLRTEIYEMHKRPRGTAGFSVLKSAHIPSVLIELGFLSSEKDRKNLLTPEWRARAATGISAALSDWALSDAARRDLVRQ